jgi:hypothetical protein
VATGGEAVPKLIQIFEANFKNSVLQP